MYSPDIIPACKQMGLKAMPQSMRGDVLVGLGSFEYSSDGFLPPVGIGMVALQFVAAWIPGDVLGWKDVLPFPLKLRTRVSDTKCIWEGNPAEIVGDIVFNAA